ncbi:Z1 domain-containing protein [Catellatospora citrea]|uniref:Endonuclease n=1 Tax=Catellatospora citrea TaxID=53366 RepID=A0A8J3K535_9ACTN|nr:Z1 domain-containing protein [Catellatospora citrea]RKE11125.1 Z1 domain-containing protein [Catellatospora citrea]GIF96587.1 endonuclease [Catellatospora citrea]
MNSYTVFADWARRFGVDAAVQSLSDAFAPEKLEAFRTQFELDKAKVQAGGPPIITAGSDDWYSGPNAADRYWPALKNRFEADGWPDERVGSVDHSSSTVVAHTPRPERTKWDSKGLVVGYVQSGKTTNFTAVIAKLADVQYRLVIVLSGIHNGLRRQTQVRLDQYLKDLNPDRWVTLTEESRDFVKPAHEFAAVLSSEKTVLAVVKKNAAVLGKLIKWLDTANGRKALETAAVLVVDDEADQASVATGRINPLVRKLLGLMPRCTYVGYTATPFANVFVDPTQDDLYPKSFILNLPRPDGYFGPETIFGRDAVEGEDDDELGPPDGYDMVRTVEEADVPLLRPGGKEPADGFAPTMIDPLVTAVHWFWLATAARRARGDDGHSTMLIHTSVKIAVHESYRAPLQTLQRRASEELTSGRPEVLDRWRRVWEEESAKVPAEEFDQKQNTFDDLLPHLGGVVDATRIVLDNYRSQDRLDYSAPSVVAIAVGGNTLSRGLTLEGLVVSFFVRGATAYDTLLQMGRWFGYRTGFEDLPRIWMTPSLNKAFRHLATVEHEMRDDIDRYQRENLTPTQVAVRIRTHPSLRITAKMGAAQPAYISYAGRRLQTRYFEHADAEWLHANREAAESLVQEATLRGVVEDVGAARLIRDVPVSLIKQFLSRYRVHEESPDLDTTLMIKYIDQQLTSEQPSLAVWSVAVVVGEGDPATLGGMDVNYSIRSRLINGQPGRADIKTLMSKQDRALDLAVTPAEAKAKSESELVALRNADPVCRDRGLLVLYLIDPISEPVRTQRPDAVKRTALAAVSPVVGMGVIFPGDAGTKKIQATHVAVDLTDVESENVDEALDTDTEEPA